MLPNCWLHVYVGSFVAYLLRQIFFAFRMEKLELAIYVIQEKGLAIKRQSFF